MNPQSPEMIAMISALAGFLAVKVFDLLFASKTKHDDLIKENTIAITALQIEIKHLNEKLAYLYRLKDDVDAAHRSIRELRGNKAPHESQ